MAVDPPDRADLRAALQEIADDSPRANASLRATPDRSDRCCYGPQGHDPQDPHMFATPDRADRQTEFERLREALCEAIWNNDPTDGYLADPAVVRLLVDAVLTDPNVKWALAAPEAE